MSSKNKTSYGENQGKKINTKDFEKELKSLYNMNLSLGAIGQELGWSRSTVSKHLKELGISIKNTRMIVIDMVDDNHARCSSCDKIKPLSDYMLMKSRSKNLNRQSYHFHRCKACEYLREVARTTTSIDHYLNKKFSTFKSNAKRNEIIFELEANYLKEVYTNQKGLCFYSDVRMSWQRTTKNGREPRSITISIDKIIPELGYIKGNVVFCADRVNVIKNNATLEEIRAWMPFWYNRIIRHFCQFGVTHDGEYLIFPNGSKYPHKKLQRH